MPRTDERGFLIWVMQGNGEAVAFLEQVFRISQVWDDIIDGDKEVPREAVNKAFWEAITLPENPFYARHFDKLQPVMQVAMADWMAANQLEKGDAHDRNIAFVIRDNLASLIMQCARLVGGFDWAQEIAPAIRRHIHEESLEEYKEGLP